MKKHIIARMLIALFAIGGIANSIHAERRVVRRTYYEDGRGRRRNRAAEGFVGGSLTGLAIGGLAGGKKGLLPGALAGGFLGSAIGASQSDRPSGYVVEETTYVDDDKNNDDKEYYEEEESEEQQPKRRRIQ